MCFSVQSHPCLVIEVNFSDFASWRSGETNHSMNIIVRNVHITQHVKKCAYDIISQVKCISRLILSI